MASILGTVKGKSEKSVAELQESADEIDAKVPAEVRDHYDAIVVAGGHLLWGDKTHDVLVNNFIKNNIKTEKDIPQAVAKGIAQLVGLVLRKSGQRPEELAPAAMIASQTLMIHVLIYLEKRKKFAISNRIFAETTYATTKAMFKLFGITKEKFKATIQELHKRAKNQEEMPEGEEAVPFDESQELPPDEETPEEETAEGAVPPPAEPEVAEAPAQPIVPGEEAAPPEEGTPV